MAKAGISPAVQMRALARRKERVRTRIEWFGEKVKNGIKVGMTARLRIAGQLLRDMVVVNISRPVRKYRSKRTGRIVVDRFSRSRPGEYPKADTTRLMKDIYYEMRGKENVRVGTTLDYGLILETRMKRSFLRRTLNENRSALGMILVRGTGNTVKFPGEK